MWSISISRIITSSSHSRFLFAWSLILDMSYCWILKLRLISWSKKWCIKKTYLCDRALLLIWFLILIISKSFWAFVKMWRLTSRISSLNIISLWLRKSIMFWYSISHFYWRVKSTRSEEIKMSTWLFMTRKLNDKLFFESSSIRIFFSIKIRMKSFHLCETFSYRSWENKK
jgi:hypothetical protein